MIPNGASGLSAGLVGLRIVKGCPDRKVFQEFEWPLKRVIETTWFVPSEDGRSLLVAMAKGLRARQRRRPAKRGDVLASKPGTTRSTSFSPIATRNACWTVRTCRSIRGLVLFETCLHLLTSISSPNLCGNIPWLQFLEGKMNFAARLYYPKQVPVNVRSRLLCSGDICRQTVADRPGSSDDPARQQSLGSWMACVVVNILDEKVRVAGKHVNVFVGLRAECQQILVYSTAASLHLC